MRVWMWMLALSMGCGSNSAPVDPEPDPEEPRASVSSVENGSEPTASDQTPEELDHLARLNPDAVGFVSSAQLAEAGFRAEDPSLLPTREYAGPNGPAPAETGHAFLCRGGETGVEGANCICQTEPPCAEDNEDCITLDQNLAAFREARANPDLNVHCERAEVGHCGDFRYFYFQGGIHRYEMRWFDATGRLVAQRNSTDYPGYCNGTMSEKWDGPVPDCETLVTDELICGEGTRPLRTPLEDLLAFTTSRTR